MLMIGRNGTAACEEEEFAALNQEGRNERHIVLGFHLPRLDRRDRHVLLPHRAKSPLEQAGLDRRQTRASKQCGTLPGDRRLSTMWRRERFVSFFVDAMPTDNRVTA